MNLPADVMRYFVWAGVVAAGTLLAVVGRRWIRLPVFGALLVAGIGGGITVTNVSSFTFGTGGYYMEGVIVTAGSALALTGYVLGAGWLFLRRRFGGHGS